MTTNQFRVLALSLPEVVEKSHFAHPDFRVRGKIFGTLGFPRSGWGVVMLTPKLQKSYLESDPDAFMPVKGKWGLRGATKIYLRLARKAHVKEALVAAWHNKAPRNLRQKVDVQ